MPRYGPPNDIGLPSALPFGHDDVGAVVAGPLEQAQADRIDRRRRTARRRRARSRPSCSTSSRQPKKFGCCTSTQAVSVVDGRGQLVGRDRAVGRADGDQLDAEVRQVRGQDLAIFGMDAAGDDDAAVAAGGADGHQHGFGRGAAAVVEAGVRDVHAGELGDQRLILEEDLQVALAGLGLIGRVRGVELAARGDVVDDRRDEMVVAAAAQEADLLAGRRCSWRPAPSGARVSSISVSAGGMSSGRSSRSSAGIDGEQFVDRLDADRLEHRPLVFGSIGNVRHA